MNHLARDGDGRTEVVARSCGATQEAAFDALPLSVRSKAANTKLLTVYEHTDWKGKSDSFTGDSGPCDGEGYYLLTSISNIAIVGGISSYTTFNNCNGSRTCYWADQLDHCADGYGNVRYVGDECNDHVYSMHLYRLW